MEGISVLCHKIISRLKSEFVNYEIVEDNKIWKRLNAVDRSLAQIYAYIGHIVVV